MVDIHNRIKDIRKHFKINQVDFAKMIEISRDNLAQIETNRSLPSLKTAFLIVKYFNINYE